MTTDKNIANNFLVKKVSEGWLLKARNNSPIAYVFESKKKAVENGKFLAKTNLSELQIIDNNDPYSMELIKYN